MAQKLECVCVCVCVCDTEWAAIGSELRAISCVLMYDLGLYVVKLSRSCCWAVWSRNLSVGPAVGYRLQVFFCWEGKEWGGARFRWSKVVIKHIIMPCVWNLSSIPKHFQQLSVPWLTENKQRNYVHWPSTLLVMYHSFLLFFCTGDVGSRFLWNYFVFIPDHAASLPGRPLWEYQILHLFHLRKYSTNFC